MKRVIKSVQDHHESIRERLGKRYSKEIFPSFSWSSFSNCFSRLRMNLTNRVGEKEVWETNSSATRKQGLSGTHQGSAEPPLWVRPNWPGPHWCSVSQVVFVLFSS